MSEVIYNVFKELSLVSDYLLGSTILPNGGVFLKDSKDPPSFTFEDSYFSFFIIAAKSGFGG